MGASNPQGGGCAMMILMLCIWIASLAAIWFAETTDHRLTCLERAAGIPERAVFHSKPGCEATP